jgi:hypothetical protein
MHADQLEIGMADEMSQRVHPDVAGAPLDHAMRHASSQVPGCVRVVCAVLVRV